MRQDSIPTVRISNWKKGHTSISSLSFRSDTSALLSSSLAKWQDLVLPHHPGMSTQQVTNLKGFKSHHGCFQAILPNLLPLPRSFPRSRTSNLPLPWWCRGPQARHEDLAALFWCFTSKTITRVSFGWRAMRFWLEVVQLRTNHVPTEVNGS